MDLMSGDISHLVFRRTVQEDPGEFSVDGDMLNILVELNGEKKVKEVAEKTGVNLVRMREILTRFLEMDLVESIDMDQKMLSRDFYDYLIAQLSRAVGPIAGILVEEASENLGYRLFQIPQSLAAELIDLVARDIRRQQKGLEFKQRMLEKIKEGG
jgi:hypothetical protein